MSAKKYCLLYVTAKNEDEAKALGRKLVEKRLAACVNILPRMHSIYWWEGKLDSSDEAVLLVKTTSNKYKQAEAFILSHHSYTTPCVLRLSVDGGSKAYLKWLSESLLG
jgi:periplasmic divalent cation tolerance protein